MSDWVDDLLIKYFDPAHALRGITAHVGGYTASPASPLGAIAGRLRIEATARGVRRVALAHAGGGTGPRRVLERARAELGQYLAGRRTYFSIPVDLEGIGEFQARVLAETARIPFGTVRSYAALARRVGRPRAARAVGNALAANPVPVLVPCHRVIRGDGTWGQYALGERLKTALLRLERATPVLVGSTSTRIVCRHGCAREQRVGEERRIVFASVAEARALGYRPCQVCRPQASWTSPSRAIWTRESAGRMRGGRDRSRR